MLPGYKVWCFLFEVGHLAAGPADELDGVDDIRCLYVLGSVLPSLMSCDDGGRIFEGVVCAAPVAAGMLALSGGGRGCVVSVE